MESTLGDRVRATREQLGISRPQLAAMTKIGYSTLAEIENGGMRSTTKLHVIARELGVSVDWLATGSGAPGRTTSPVSTLATPAGYVRYQLMDAQGGAGPGVLNSDFPEVLREVEVAEWQLRQEIGHVPLPSRVKLLTVRGESMLPRIRNGDVVFVDVEDQQIQDGGLFVIALHGFTLVKRLEVRTDGLHIVSLAAPDRPDVVPPDKMESLHIKGRVLGAIQLRRAEDL